MTFHLQNLDLLAVGIAIAAIGLLGFIIFFNNRKSITNQSFLIFSSVTIIWSIFNYLSYQFTSPNAALWLLRIVLFTAVWHSFALYSLLYVFPSEKIKFSWRYKFILLPVVIFTSFFVLTPFVFPRIEVLAPVGQVSKIKPEMGILLFGAVVVGLIANGLFFLIKKMRSAIGVEKIQFKYILIGIVLTFFLLITFNFILPAFFDNQSLIPLGAVFLLPFVAFTAYAIIKHGFLNVKLIATEIFAFMIAVVTFIEIIVASSLQEVLLRVSIFSAVLLFDVLLIRSVIQERKTREQIETLNMQLQKSMEELQKIDEVKTEFVSLASHQLRTPLTSIKGYSDMLRAGEIGGQLNSDQRDAMEKIFVSAQRMVELIDDILNISKLEKEGGFEYQFSIANPQAVIEKVVNDFQGEAKAKGLSLSFESKLNPEAKAKFDPVKFSEAIGNILSDSVKYTLAGNVWVKLFEDEDEVILSIKDTGIGIDRDDIPKIFQKFFRTKAVSRLSAEGTGLGLYFTRRVLEDHGGHIWVESPGLEKGSQFIVKLPKMTAKMQQSFQDNQKMKETQPSSEAPLPETSANLSQSQPPIDAPPPSQNPPAL